ncbi:hypothetical protein MNB_SV-8-963 [hydrothermal vent metagenome]|uniref:Uncharacterized protein n=1 Tax=hydrothermal vent metagenome TaxID=652676 RepID=A0A1W1BVL5_9ZZZZ
MQTIHINVDENKVDVLLNIIKNLKEDIVDSYTVSPVECKDAFYDTRKKRLQQLRKDIKSGKVTMYDFDTSTDDLMKELQA